MWNVSSDLAFIALQRIVALDATISNVNRMLLARRSSHALAVDPVEFDLDDLESQKFMRTKSTAELKGQPPGEKWQGMMRMFSEWKVQTNAAQGQKMYSSLIWCYGSDSLVASPLLSRHQQ